MKRFLIHLLFWVGVWFFFYYFFSYNSDVKPYIIGFSSSLLPLTMGVTYFVERFLIPRYLLARKYWLFVLYSFYTLVASSYLIVLAIYGCIIFLLNFDVSIIPPMSKNFFFILILVYIVVGAVSFISVLNSNFKTDSQNKALQNKILATQLQLKEQELVYLKRQIHPHFLFNTLNTIYGLALKQSKQAPDVILKLSNLLDYILYQINKPKVALSDEVKHVKEYIELEKIRFRDTLQINLNIDNIANHIMVAPMLLIPFVENAFKHGDLINGIMSVNMGIEQDGSFLKFKLSNSCLKTVEENKNGIGLRNIRKRLDLHYKGNYRLKHEIGEQQYRVCLTINDVTKLRYE